MRIKLLTCLLIFLLALPLTAAPPAGKEDVWRLQKPTAAEQVDNTTFIDANLILMFVTNHGNYGRDLAGVFGFDYGTWFPFTGDTADISKSISRKSPYYAGGLWMGAVDSATGQTRVIVSEYSDEYVPGPMVNGTFSPDKPEYRVYKIYRDSLEDNPNADYLNWPVDQGAPVDDEGKPELVGDQMLWSVFNDADPDQHTNNSGETAPMGIEVQSTTFAFDRNNALGQIVFIRFRIYNKGGNTLLNCFFSPWSDPDLGLAGDDLVGCDTTLGLGYVYNSTNDDSQYGEAPPSLGIDFFQGPLIYTGDDADTAKMWNTTWVGYQNMGMTSFNKYINGTDPDNFGETYNYMRGLNRDGTPYTYNGQVLKFVHTGDPVAGTGDLDIAPADRRWMQSTGPVTFRPGDSTEIVVAIVVGQGEDYLKSITAMKNIDDFAQNLYENDFQPPQPPDKPDVNVAQLSNRVVLSWDNLSEIEHGDYDFEGYSIWQGDGPSSQANWELLATYDIADGILNLIDSVSQNGILLPYIVRECSDNGLTYKFIATRDFLVGGNLNNYTEYYFKVSAFSYNPEAVPGFKVLESETIVRATPKGDKAGETLNSHLYDTLTVDHTGPGDGSVVPYVVDPKSVTGDTYSVTFADDPVLGSVWFLVRGANDTLLYDQTNQEGNEAYQVVDGILVKVIGPPPGVKPGDMYSDPDNPSAWGWDIPSGTRRFTWAGGADGFGFEGFRGALGWASPGSVFGPFAPYPPAELTAVLLKLAAVDADGTFDPNQANVSYAYRYLRNASDPPAQPEFAPYIINAEDGYYFQDYELSCPLSAWNIDEDPPVRLTLGYMENNVAGGLVDGKYWPPLSDVADNTASSGPREWLWIYSDPYQTTPNAAYEGDATSIDMPIMYWATWARRDDVAWEDIDEFAIYPNRVNSAADTYSFNTDGYQASFVESEEALDEIRAVPNPYYLISEYDPNPGSHELRFIHLPDNCKISIYNLAGDLMRVIQKDDPTTDVATWDMLTERGLPVASGIYVYVVEAPDFGTKIGKMAIFVETQVLDIY